MKYIFTLLSFFVLITSCTKQIDYLPYITSLQSSVYALQKSRDSLVNVINSNNASLSAIQKSRDSLSNALLQTNATLSNLMNSNATILKSLDTIKNQLVGINTQINNLVTQLNGANANILLISNQISNLNQQYLDLLAKYNSIITQLNEAPASLSNNLVAYYPFTGNAGDSSGNGNHGTLVGGVSLTSDRFNKIQSAYSFDGKTGYIDVPSLNTLPYKPITYSSWIWINSYLPTNLGFQFRSIVGRNTSFILNTGEIGLYAGYGMLDNTFIMWRGGGYASALIPSSKVVPPLNSWIFITYTQNINGDWQWFINGSLTNFGNDKDTQDYYNYFRIGGDNVYDRNYCRWDGKIDDLRIYNRPLTSIEITYLYNH